MSILPYLIFGSAAILFAALLTWLESKLLVWRGWTDSKIGMKFALIVNGVSVFILAALTYLMVTVVMLGALAPTKDVFTSTVFPLLAFASPVLFFILRAVLMKRWQIGQGGALWLYAGISALLSWIVIPMALMFAIWLIGQVAS